MPASVRKAALVLDLFSVERPDWGPTEVAEALGIAKSTAHALLGELTSVGLTERLPCGRYRLGWRTLGLARTKLATSGYGEEITPTARRLASHFGETVHITAWERGRVLYAANARPAVWPHRRSLLPRSGRRRARCCSRSEPAAPAAGSNPASSSARADAATRSGLSALSKGSIAPPLRYAQATGRRPLPSRCAPRVTGSRPAATSTRARSSAPA